MQNLIKTTGTIFNYIDPQFYADLIYLNRLFFQFLIIISLSLVCTASLADEKGFKHLKQKTISDFIEFEPGVYNRVEDSAINRQLKKMNLRSTQQITLTGISQSSSSLASYGLALNRAKTVKKKLVSHGVQPNRIILGGQYENFVTKNKLINGVFVSIKEHSQNIDTIENPTNNEIYEATFIEFPLGIYNQPKPNKLDDKIKKFLLVPNNKSLHIIGKSQSKTTLASASLAMQRAKTVANKLIANGFDARRINLDTEVKNNIQDNFLSHGVLIDIVNHIPINPHLKPTEVLTEELVEPKVKKTTQIKNNISLKKQAKEDDLKVYKNRNNKNQSCTYLNIKKGSLKNNIEREIGECGYLMGEWNFGNDEEYFDWLIPLGYEVDIENGILDLLQTIEINYQIRAHVHQLDRSIDFLPSIKYERGQ